MDFGFNPLQYKYPSRRSVMYGTKGMVCSSRWQRRPGLI